MMVCLLVWLGWHEGSSPQRVGVWCAKLVHPTSLSVCLSAACSTLGRSHPQLLPPALPCAACCQLRPAALEDKYAHAQATRGRRPFGSSRPSLARIRPDAAVPHAVYDVTRRETLDAIGSHWLPEVLRYSTFPDAIKMLVANKIDRVGRMCGRSGGRQDGGHCRAVESGGVGGAAGRQPGRCAVSGQVGRHCLGR